MGLIADVIANAPILSSWGNAIRDRTVQRFATATERAAQWATPPTGACCWLDAPGVLAVYNGAAWVTITPVMATVPANQSTASGSYTDLSTAGPSVAIQTGTKARVFVSAFMANNTVGGGAAMSFAVSGATTAAANDVNAAQVSYTNVVNTGVAHSFESLVTGLTPGVNTFTAKYSRNAAGIGTANFANRTLTVEGIPL